MQSKVFALGNALIDYEYKVSDALLTSIGISKGSAKLALTSTEQQNTLSLLQENGANFVKKASGGSAANTMFAVSALGGVSSFSFCVGNDEAGHFYLNDLQESGVETSVDSYVESDEPTGSCIVMVTDDAERTMQAHLGVSGEVSFSCVDEELLQTATYIYIEGYLASNAKSVEAVLQVQAFARDHGIKTALSFSDPSVVNFSKPALLEMLSDGVDVLFCNKEEALIFTDETDLESATQKLHQYTDLLVVTLGDKGAFVSEKTLQGVHSFTKDAFTTPTVVDTNGAGDNFAGAFLYGITHDMSLEQSTELAVHIAGQLVSRFGPRMPKEIYTSILEAVHNSLVV